MDGCSRQDPAYRPATEKPRSGGAFLLIGPDPGMPARSAGRRRTDAARLTAGGDRLGCPVDTRRRGILMMARKLALQAALVGALALWPVAALAKDFSSIARDIVPSGQYGSAPLPANATPQAQLYHAAPTAAAGRPPPGARGH